MQIYRLNINKHLCSGCNDCVVACPVNFERLRVDGFLNQENAVILVKNGLSYEIYDEARKNGNCTGCGICINACPQRAIQIVIEDTQ